MDPPSSRGDGASATGARSSSVNQMAFCHECGIEIRPLMTPDPTCPRCNGQFVEIIEEGAQGHPHDFGRDDDQDDANNPFAPIYGDPFPGFNFRTGGGGTAAPPLSFVQAGPATQLPGGLGGLLMALASGAQRGPQSPASTGTESNRGTTTLQDTNSQRSSSHTEGQGDNRSGSASFGPFGLQWNVQYGSGGGDSYQRAAQHLADQNQQQQSQVRSPPTLSNFLRFAFGPEQTSAAATPDEDSYFHDDGMGGAGSAADGRHVNHNNRGTYYQPPQSPGNSAGRGTGAAGSNNDLPPELSALRNLFTGLFGEPGAQGGSLLDILASGAHGGMGPRGQWGDYVLGQQGLDDIISQLMEQAQGSNAPPPATEDEIDKLERFTLSDKDRVEKAKNQDCPTCKDDFLPSQSNGPEEEAKQEAEEDKQQEELISMPCNHVFHVDCLVPWLRLHGTCPVCRISIAKPSEEEQSHETSTNSGGQPQSQSTSNDTLNASVPGGWPSPPNAFTSSFGNMPHRASEGVHIPRDSPEATTTTYHPQPPASTTVTSTVYPSPPATAGQRSGTGLADVEVVNSIVSSPPIVSDRDDFLAAPQSQHQDSGDMEDMRATLRRAAEARLGAEQTQSLAQQQNPAARNTQPTLEPDELD